MPRASSLVFATYLGNGNVNGIARDGSGNLCVTGFGRPPFPVTPGAMPGGDTFFAQLDPDATTLLYSTLLPNGSASHAVALGPSVPAVLGAAGVLTTFGLGDPSRATIYAVANAGGRTLHHG